MNDFVAELYILKGILRSNMTLKESYFKCLTRFNLSKEEGQDVMISSISILRNYQKLYFLVCEAFPSCDPTSDEFLLLIILVYQYNKGVDKEIVDARYRNTGIKYRLIVESKQSLDRFKTLCEEKAISISQYSKPDHVLSLIYEIPEFLITKIARRRDVNEDYITDSGNYRYLEKGSKTREILKSLHQRVHDLYIVDPYVLSKDPYEYDSRFTKKTFSDETSIYKVEDGSLKDLKSLHLYKCSYIVKKAVSEISLPHLSPRILLDSIDDIYYPTPFVFKICSTVSPLITEVYENAYMYRNACDKKKRDNRDNLQIILSEVEILKTYVELESYDLVVSFAKDSSLGLLNKRAEIMPSLTLRKISESYTKELANLLEMARFVKDSGTLLFISNALIDEEGRDVVDSFLNRCPDFYLEKDEYITPDEFSCDGGYYAILRRKA